MPEIKLTIDGTEYEIKNKGVKALMAEENPTLYFDSNLYEFKKSKEKDIPKQDYKIMSFIYKGRERKRIEGSEDCFEGGGTEDYQLLHASINSVKRLDNSEILTIDDITNHGRITGFWVGNHNTMFASFEGYKHIDILSLQKVKPKVPLFDCLDGCTNFIGDYVYPVRKADCWADEPFTTSFDMKGLPTKNEQWIYFSSEEKRTEWLLLNKPIEVSYKELYEYCANEDHPSLPLTKRVKEFFKSKINP